MTRKRPVLIGIAGGTGSGTHMNSEKLLLATGITATHVPYKGTPEGLVEVAAGRLDWFFSPAAATVALVKDGRLKALAVSSKRRMAMLPASVKVRQRMFSGAVSVSSRILPIRQARICVFPVPGPAITITGPSMVSTASRCAGLSRSYSF